MDNTESLVAFKDSKGNTDFSLKKSDVDAIFSAQDKIGIISDVEMSHDAFITSFIDFKALVYRKTLESALWTIAPYKDAHDARVVLNIALASVLNSARALTDKLQHSCQSGSVLKPLGKKIASKVRKSVEEEYDNNLNYFLMYQSRNYLQHSGIIIDKITRQSAIRNDGFYERKLLLLLNVEALISNAKIEFDKHSSNTDKANSANRKLARLETADSAIHLMVSLEEYVLSIWRIITTFRESVSETYNTEIDKHKEAVASIERSMQKHRRSKNMDHEWGDLLFFCKYNGRNLPLSLEWNLVDSLLKKNPLAAMDKGLNVVALDYGRRSGYYDIFYDKMGLTPPK